MPKLEGSSRSHGLPSLLGAIGVSASTLQLLQGGFDAWTSEWTCRFLKVMRFFCFVLFFYQVIFTTDLWTRRHPITPSNYVVRDLPLRSPLPPPLPLLFVAVGLTFFTLDLSEFLRSRYRVFVLNSS